MSAEGSPAARRRPPRELDVLADEHRLLPSADLAKLAAVGVIAGEYTG